MAVKGVILRMHKLFEKFRSGKISLKDFKDQIQKVMTNEGLNKLYVVAVGKNKSAHLKIKPQKRIPENKNPLWKFEAALRAKSERMIKRCVREEAKKRGVKVS